MLTNLEHLKMPWGFIATREGNWYTDVLVVLCLFLVTVFLVNINLIISFHQCHISLMVFAWTYLCLWCQSVTFLEGCFVFYSIYLCAIDLARKAPLQQSAKKGKTLVIEGKASLQCLRGVIQFGPIGFFWVT